ncbi:MAG: hypothetical protein F4X11_00695 [Acidobacteria bacterium]|nr:hypothetical protein [Acidobacteriota bacterium]
MPSIDPPERVLLVEGESDLHVVHHLCRRQDEPMPSFRIEDKGTLGQVLDAIGPELKVSGRKALGVLVDADDSLADRWGDLSNRCRAANIDLPHQPPATGTILEQGNGRPRIGIWLMPDNESPGELEDFVRTMVPTDDPVWPRSENYIDRIPVADRRFRPGKLLRAKLYAWLATRENPGRMGAAIRARDLRVDGVLGSTFAQWLRSLFR